MLLQVEDIVVGYGRRPVLYGVSLSVDKGEKVTLIGHNGAGKSTTLKAILGILKVKEGRITYKGQSIGKRAVSENIRDGITLVPQGRAIFGKLSVEDNIKLGGFIADESVFQQRLGTVYALFPILKQRKGQQAGTLSGGEQRMLSLSLGLMQGPELLLLDEPSVGLAPVLVKEVMKILEQINKNMGISILLVEQNVQSALQFAERAYVIKSGKIIEQADAKEILNKGQLWELF